MDKHQDMQFAIRRVKEISFGVSEELYRINNPGIKINFEHRNEIVPDSNLFNFAFRVYFFYEDEPELLLVDLHVANFFEVVNLKDFVDSQGRIAFKENVWAGITGMAISHSRAFMCKNLAGTPYDKFVIPVMNAAVISKQFFPVTVENDLKTEKASTQ